MSEPGTNQFLQTNDTTQTAQMLPPDQTNPQLAVAAEEGMNPGAATYTRPSMKVPPTRKDDRKLFVGGLPANITSEEFHSFFEQFGPVIDSIVMVDKVTNRSRGFGFVTFERSDTARHLLAMGNPQELLNPASGRLEMMGKLIEVKVAQPKQPMRQANRMDAKNMHRAYMPALPANSMMQHMHDSAYAMPVMYPQNSVYGGYGVTAAPMYSYNAHTPSGLSAAGYSALMPSYYASPTNMIPGNVSSHPPSNPFEGGARNKD